MKGAIEITDRGRSKLIPIDNIYQIDEIDNLGCQIRTKEGRDVFPDEIYADVVQYYLEAISK